MKSISSMAALIAILLTCTAPAAAHEFANSPEESGLGGKGGTQTITLGSNTVNCKSAAINGHATSELLYMEVGYESCEAFSKPATVSEARYTLNANGTGGIAGETLMTITVKPTVESECVYTLPETSKLVTSVSYASEKTGITISSALEGLAFELKETGTSVCGKNGEKSNKGGYKGKVTTESYEGAKCRFWGPGGFYKLFCWGDGGGWWEEVFGYVTLEWS